MNKTKKNYLAYSTNPTLSLDKPYKKSYTERDLFLEGFNSDKTVKPNEKETNMFYKKDTGIKTLPLYPTPEANIAKLSYNPNKTLPLVQQERNYTPMASVGLEKAQPILYSKSPAGKIKDLLNDASAWVNGKGFFDDITNAFFKASDLSQDYPGKIIKTGLAHKMLANSNYKENQKIDLSGYEATGGYINDQNILDSPSGKLRYGYQTFGKNGCELIAVNNALVSLGNRKDVRDIAKAFETDGQALFGLFGTSPYAIRDYFKKEGYQVKTFEGDKKIYNLNIPDADTYIISFWNSEKITSAIHTVSIDKLPNGKYRIYNERGKCMLDVDSITGYLREKNRVPLVLHCIKKG